MAAVYWVDEKLKIKFLQLAIVISFLNVAQAQDWDATISGGLLTRPRSTGVGAVLGLTPMTWGDIKASPLKYGYLRFESEFSTAIVVNGIEAKAQIFPLSFFGIGIGSSESRRNSELEHIDCDFIECRRSLHRDFVEATTTLGSELLFTKVDYRYERLGLTHNPAQIPFADEWSKLVGAQGGDRLTKMRLLLGHRFNGEYTFGVLAGQEKMERFKSSNERYALWARKTVLDKNILLRVGSYRSTTTPLGIEIGFLIEWTLKPKTIGL